MHGVSRAGGGILTPQPVDDLTDGHGPAVLASMPSSARRCGPPSSSSSSPRQARTGPRSSTRSAATSPLTFATRHLISDWPPAVLGATLPPLIGYVRNPDLDFFTATFRPVPWACRPRPAGSPAPPPGRPSPPARVCASAERPWPGTRPSSNRGVRRAGRPRAHRQQRVGGERQLDLEVSALPGRRAHRHRAAVRGDEPGHDRQPEPGPARSPVARRVGPVEPLEDALRLGGVHPRPVVLDVEHHGRHRPSAVVALPPPSSSLAQPSSGRPPPARVGVGL